MANPKWMDFATAELGTKETSGSANNPRVVEYLKSAKGEKLPDATPWCAGFVGWCLNQAGYPDSDSLMARSYAKYGVPLDKPKVGAIAVYSRGEPPSGHVGFWVGEDGANDILLGGNQSDAVSKAPIAKSRLIAYRWPEPVAKPSAGQGSAPLPEATTITHRDVKKTGKQGGLILLVSAFIGALAFVLSKIFGAH